MHRSILRAVLQLTIAAFPGCSWDFAKRSSPGVTADLGTSQPVLNPTNNDRFWNGEPLDLRRGRER